MILKFHYVTYMKLLCLFFDLKSTGHYPPELLILSGVTKLRLKPKITKGLSFLIALASNDHNVVVSDFSLADFSANRLLTISFLVITKITTR